MTKRAIRNPIRRYKDRYGLTYPKLAKRLGISEDYAKKLGSGGVRSLSLARAKEIEDLTDGEIKFLDLVRWASEPEHNGGAAA
jgi:DNA-binding transcriptional regulator YdaS (Cro superfamily)